ncbi:MAG: HAD-IA family hydrolase, partial [Oceanospirillaceae bacterium]
LLKGDISYLDYRTKFLENAKLSDLYGPVFDRECVAMFEIAYSYTEEMINKLAESFKLYLLSDHVVEWTPQIMTQHKFFDKFEDCMWSYEIGATKKTTVPFEAILEKFKLSPEKCLFVDDNAENIINATLLGFNCLHFRGEESVDKIYRAIEKG